MGRAPASGGDGRPAGLGFGAAMDTQAPGRWRRRRPEELQVPGDPVSPRGLGVGNGKAAPLGGPQWAEAPGGSRRPGQGGGLAEAAGMHLSGRGTGWAVP